MNIIIYAIILLKMGACGNITLVKISLDLGVGAVSNARKQKHKQQVIVHYKLIS